METLYRSYGLVHDQQLFRHHVGLDIFQHQPQLHIPNKQNLLIHCTAK